VVWLFHQHRGAYDGADEQWSGFDKDDVSLETQRLLANWDARALEEAVGLFTTSGVVADRLLRYNGLAATPLYHPPPLQKLLHPGPHGGDVFCATRLEANKRPELLVEAMAASTSGARMVIAGSGSLAEPLAAMARRLGVADRIQWLGYVGDDELVARYASASAVVYVPFDEDYGYVTLQAFCAAKPVITAKDAGGVLEWVTDGENGIVTDGSPHAIGEAIDSLVRDPALARRMGEAGHVRVRDLSWAPVVERLVDFR